MYVRALWIGFILLSSEGETLSGIYQQLREVRAKGKLEEDSA